MNEKNILSHLNSNSSSKVYNSASIETNTSIKTNNNNNSSNSNLNKREDDYYYKTYYTRDPNEIEIHEKIVQIKPPVSPRTTSFTSNTPNNSNTPYFITNLNKKISHNSSNSIKSEISFILNNNNQSHDEKVKANYYLSSSPSSTSSSMSNSHLIDNTNQGSPNKTDNSNYINEMDEINSLSNKGLVKNLCKKFSPEDLSSLSSAQTPTPSSTPSLPSSNSYRNNNNNNNNKNKDNDIIKRNHEKFIQSNSKNNKKMNTSSVSLNILKNFELKKCQSVIFDAFDASSSSNANTKTSLSNSNTQLNKLDSCYVDIPINYQKAVKSKSNNCLSNEAYDEANSDDSTPMKKSSFRGGGEEDVFENVDIKEKINKFTFMNEGTQLPLRLAKGSNKSISRINTEANAYGGSCNNLSSNSLNKIRQAKVNSSIAGSSDDTASSTHDSANSTFSDDTNSSDLNCNHKASLGGVLGLFESINFNSVKFDESYKKIKDGFVS